MDWQIKWPKSVSAVLFTSQMKGATVLLHEHFTIVDPVAEAARITLLSAEAVSHTFTAFVSPHEAAPILDASVPTNL